MNPAKVKRFVQQKLGCACPDDVFERIKVKSGNAKTLYQWKIVIGQKLLITICQIDERRQIEKMLRSIVISGKKERDRHGLKRFRVVLATEEVDRLAPVAKRVFEDLRSGDEKMHLHVVRMEDVKDLKEDSMGTRI